MTETGPHTGIFQAKAQVLRGAPTPNSGKVETNAAMAEGSATQFDDLINLSYQDDTHLSVTETGSRIVTQSVQVFDAVNASLTPVEHDITRVDLEIKTLLYKGRSLTQIAATYRDLGQTALLHHHIPQSHRSVPADPDEVSQRPGSRGCAVRPVPELRGAVGYMMRLSGW